MMLHGGGAAGGSAFWMSSSGFSFRSAGVGPLGGGGLLAYALTLLFAAAVFLSLHADLTAPLITARPFLWRRGSDENLEGIPCGYTSGILEVEMLPGSLALHMDYAPLTFHERKPEPIGTENGPLSSVQRRRGSITLAQGRIRGNLG